MKVYDKDLKEMGDIPEQYNEMFHQQFSFIKKLTGNDEKTNKTILDRIRKTKVVNCSEKLNNKLVRPTVYNGEVRKVSFPSGAGALAGLSNQTLSEQGWDFETGIYIRANAYNPEDKNSYKGTLPHEFFHAMSTNVSAKFNKNGTCYTKCGFGVIEYNQKDEEVSKIPANGLTEGVTEMLADMYNNTLEPHVYTFPTFISRILNESKYKPSLLDAYLSEDKSTVEKYFDNFERNQKTASSSDLINMTTSENAWQDPKSLNLITGCLEYTVSSLTSVEELQNFYNYMKDITINIAGRQNKEMVKKIQTSVASLLNQKKKQISAIKAPEGMV